MKFAERILPHLTDSVAAGHLIGHGAHATSDLRAAVPAAVANRLYKGPLDTVAVIAKHPGTDSKVLARYAKDPRVAVRHALLSNPSLPYEQAMMLLRWAHERGDHEQIRSAFAVTYAGASLPGPSATDLLACLALLDDARGYPASAAARTVSERGTADDVRAAWQFVRHDGLRSRLLRHAYLGNSPLTYRELLHTPVAALTSRQEHAHWANVLVMAMSVDHVDDELAEDVATAAAHLHAATMLRQERWSFKTVSEKGLDTLLACGEPTLIATCLSRGLVSDALNGVLRRPSHRLIAALFGEERSPITEEQQRILVGSVFSANAADRQLHKVLYGYLKRLPHPLSFEELELFFCALPSDAIGEWLGGNLEYQPPRPGEISRLGENLPRYLQQMSSNERESFATGRLLHCCEQLLRRRGLTSWEAEELLVAFDAQFNPTKVGRSHSVLWQLLTADIERRIGGRLDLLDTIVSLGDEWEEGFDSLVRAAGLMEGLQLERPTAVEAAEDPNGQLRLL